ncbi:ribonuclease H-like domain-containing protein [Russula compacta]|nr:ribonuclease H-like domain-containing protein [Russula compacta]
MRSRCHRGLTCLAFTPLRGCSSSKTQRGYLTSRSRGFSGSPPLDTYMGQPQLCVRTQSNPISTGHSANLLPRHNSALAGTRSGMDLPANVATLAPYDWRTFAPGAQLHYIRTEATTNERIARIASRPGPFIIGLDFEWRPTFEARRPENPIALVQLACDDEILLVHVSAMKAFPSGLRDVLESANSRKVGVGIQYDCKKLWKDHRVSVRNCVDLALLARTVDTRWKGPYKGGIGLSRLAEVYLKRILPKGDIQRSDWEMELSTQQQEYAANDSQSGLAIYGVLDQRALNLTPAPEAEWYSFDAIKGVLRDDEGRPWFPFNPRYDGGVTSCTVET